MRDLETASLGHVKKLGKSTVFYKAPSSQHVATRWPNARNMLRPNILPFSKFSAPTIAFLAF